jgi:hypothetical protein
VEPVGDLDGVRCPDVDDLVIFVGACVRDDEVSHEWVGMCCGPAAVCLAVRGAVTTSMVMAGLRISQSAEASTLLRVRPLVHTAGRRHPRVLLRQGNKPQGPSLQTPEHRTFTQNTRDGAALGLQSSRGPRR